MRNLLELSAGHSNQKSIKLHKEKDDKSTLKVASARELTTSVRATKEKEKKKLISCLSKSRLRNPSSNGTSNQSPSKCSESKSPSKSTSKSKKRKNERKKAKKVVFKSSVSSPELIDFGSAPKTQRFEFNKTSMGRINE